MKKISLISAFFFALSASAFAADFAPMGPETQVVSGAVNYNTPALLGWSYEKTGNNRDSVTDHAVFIMYHFEASGRVGRSVTYTVVPGLTWNSDFTQVVYEKADGSQVICASQIGRKLIHSQACSVTGYFERVVGPVDSFTKSNIISVYHGTFTAY